MRRRRAIGAAAVATAALCLTCLPAAQTSASTPPAAHGAGPAPQAQVWVTTADGAQRLQQQPPVAFATARPT
jgi:glucosylceramidase